jgi:hypothetical protein
MEQKVRHEDLLFMRVRVIRYGETSKVEVLPRHLNLTAELTRGKPHHVLREFIGCIPLFCPKAVGGGLPRQAAALIFLAASTRTRVIPADFLADMKTHKCRDITARSRRKQEAKVFDHLRMCFADASTVGAPS